MRAAARPEKGRGEERRHAVLALGVTAAMVAVLLAGWWGLGGRGGPRVVGVGEPIDIPGGQLLVADVRPEIMVHAMAPGMTMPDAIPEGFWRFTVDVRVRGGAVGTVVDPSDLHVGGDGLEPITPHRVSGVVSALPEGATLAFGALFQAPVDVDGLWIGYAGGDAVIALDGDPGDGHDHGDGHLDDGDADHDHGLPEEPDVVVPVADGAFAEPSLTVPPGTTVGWENRDPGVPHTVTFSDGGPDSGVLQPGESFSVHLDFAGTYAYRCAIHPSMRGRVIVEAAGN